VKMKINTCPHITKFAIKAVFLFFLCILTNVSIAQTCSYSLNMQDSYGDGWNGGSVHVYVNSVLIGNFSAVNSGSVAVFQLNDSDALELSYTPGAYENENSYQLYDPAWNYVFGDGPTPQTGVVFSSLGNCDGIMIPGSHPCTAIPIDTGQCIVADNSGIQGSGRKAGCADFQGGDIWFSMQVPPSGNVGFVTDSGDINDTGLAVWTDSTCTNLHLLGFDDDSRHRYFQLLNFFTRIAGQTVLIQV